jgi:hypothetical protein
MSNILTAYYQGITRQLRGEVDFINSLFEHQGVKGEGNESVLRDLIRRFIPKRYGVGTGVVIDRNGNQSNQCDIVIYDTYNYPSLLSLASVHLFPVDIVYATIEVKTTLDAGKAHEAIENIASVKALNIVPDRYVLMEPFDRGQRIMDYAPSPPKGFVFAYNSNVQQFQTFKDWFMPTETHDAPVLPTLVGCLDEGLIIYNNLSPASGTRPEGFAIPVLGQKPDGTYGHVTWAGGKVEQIQFGNEIYPAKIVNGEYVAIDQSRILLLFILYLSEILSLKRINPFIRFSDHYLTDLERYRISV